MDIIIILTIPGFTRCIWCGATGELCCPFDCAGFPTKCGEFCATDEPAPVGNHAPLPKGGGLLTGGVLAALLP